MRKRNIFLPSLFAVGILLVCIVSIHACRRREDWPCEESRTNELRVVEQATGRPVEGASVYLVSKPNGSMPEAAYNETTDQYGRVEWECSHAITHICVDAGDGYWDQCGSGYSIQDDFLVDGYYELKPKAWVHVNVVDSFPYSNDLQVAAFTDFDDSFEAEGLVPGGYYDVLGVVGGVNSILRIRCFDSDGDYISSNMMEVFAAPGDTTEYTYFY
jgi:hypothetical protein